MHDWRRGFWPSSEVSSSPSTTYLPVHLCTLCLDHTLLHLKDAKTDRTIIVIWDFSYSGLRWSRRQMHRYWYSFTSLTRQGAGDHFVPGNRREIVSGAAHHLNTLCLVVIIPVLPTGTPHSPLLRSYAAPMAPSLEGCQKA